MKLYFFANKLFYVLWISAISNFAMASEEKRFTPKKESKKFLIDLVNLALGEDKSNQRKIKASKDVSQAKWQQARAKFLPTLYSSFVTSAGEQSPGTSLKDGYDSGLSIGLEYELDFMGVDRKRLEAASLRVQSQENYSQNEREEVLKNLVISFMQWSATCSRLKARQEQLELIRNQYQLLKRQFEQGLKTMRDFARIQSELKRTEMEAFVVQQSLKNDEQKILKVIGSKEGNLDFQCESALDYKTALEMDFSLQEEGAETQKISVARELRWKALNETEEKARSLELEAQYREMKLPKVSLFVESGYGADEFLGPKALSYEETDYWKWRVGLKFSYTIWDGGMLQASYRESLALNDLQNLKSRENFLDTTLEIESNRLNLQSAKSEWSLRKDIFSFEQKSLDLVQSDYKQGRADYLELMDSLQKHIQSRIGLGDAAFDFVIAKCKVASDLGLLHGYFEKGSFVEK